MKSAAASTGGGAEPFQLDQLAGEHVDVKRWINASLQQTAAAAPSEGAAESDADAEARVTRLFNRLQSHAQEVAGAVEDTITQALVRLPRTGLEVGRMAAEAQQLRQQMRCMQEAVQPAVAAAAKPYVAQLSALKRTQEKLTRCANLLQRASEVDSSMRQLDDAVQQLRSAPEEVDMDAVAESIRRVRCNLAELQRLEATFGAKQLEALERCEQAVQHTVEVECVDRLRRRDVDRAARLLRVLGAVGRADAVLQQYAAGAMAAERGRVEALLGAAPPVTPGRAAELLRVQLVPSIGRALADELDYLLPLLLAAHGADGGRSAQAREAETRAEAALQMMAREVGGSVAAALGPVLERAERNEELAACCDAVRQLKIAGGQPSQPQHALRERVAQQATAHALPEMVQLFTRPETLDAFARREVQRVAALAADPLCALQRDRFRAAMAAVAGAVRTIVRFFPEKTLPMCAAKWREALVGAVGRLRPSPATSQGDLLRRLSAAHAVVRPLLAAEQKATADFLEAAETQRLYPSAAGLVGAQLRAQLWDPLAEALGDCAAECQGALKRTIAGPVIARAAGYARLPVWGGEALAAGARPPVAYAPASAAPSEHVRALGEAIVEIPLALEALRGDGGARLEGIDELLEEVAEPWLDDIVRAAVADFVEQKVANITIHFPASQPDGAKKEAAAVEQLAADLGYLRSVLSAVSDDPFEELEGALARLQAVGPPAGRPISVRQIINEDRAA